MQKKQWNRLGWASAVGVTFGIAAALFASRAQPSSAARTPYVVPSVVVNSGQTPANQVDDAEVQRLKVRNRRLEALVAVLRNRSVHRQNVTRDE